MKDMQRQRVYDAEWAALRIEPKGEAPSVEQMQAVIDRWCSSKVLQRRYPRAKRPPRVTDGRSRRRACYASGAHELRMPRWCRSKTMLCHELAHALVDDHVRHGWQFCECYLYLVRVFMGRHAEDALKREFKARRVRFSKPRTVTMSPEQRQRARERMLALNAEKEVAAV